jgi:DNA polymerase-3 subunit delta'
MIIGHNTQAEILQKTLNNLRHHALLLNGSKGIGKASLAKALSLKLLQQNSALPAHIIGHQINANAYPNYILLTPLTDDDGKLKREITIEQVRNLIDNLKKKAAISGTRIVLIDAVDNLNISATNALLKILEEPPTNVVFIMICQQISAILPTVRSRCMPINFKSLNEADLEQSVTNLKLKFNKELAPYCLGSVGFYETTANSGGMDLINKIIDLIKTNNLSDLKTKAQTILKSGIEENLALQILHRILYVMSLKDMNLAPSTQAVERFMRNSHNTHLDASHRLMTAILIAKDPNNSEIVNS